MEVEHCVDCPFCNRLGEGPYHVCQALEKDNLIAYAKPGKLKNCPLPILVEPKLRTATLTLNEREHIELMTLINYYFGLKTTSPVVTRGFNTLKKLKEMFDGD
jgi:hypothetical protein